METGYPIKLYDLSKVMMKNLPVTLEMLKLRRDGKKIVLFIDADIYFRYIFNRFSFKKGAEENNLISDLAMEFLFSELPKVDGFRLYIFKNHANERDSGLPFRIVEAQHSLRHIDKNEFILRIKSLDDGICGSIVDKCLKCDSKNVSDDSYAGSIIDEAVKVKIFNFVTRYYPELYSVLLQDKDVIAPRLKRVSDKSLIPVYNKPEHIVFDSDSYDKSFIYCLSGFVNERSELQIGLKDSILQAKRVDIVDALALATVSELNKNSKDVVYSIISDAPSFIKVYNSCKDQLVINPSEFPMVITSHKIHGLSFLPLDNIEASISDLGILIDEHSDAIAKAKEKYKDKVADLLVGNFIEDLREVYGGSKWSYVVGKMFTKARKDKIYPKKLDEMLNKLFCILKDERSWNKFLKDSNESCQTYIRLLDNIPNLKPFMNEEFILRPETNREIDLLIDEEGLTEKSIDYLFSRIHQLKSEGVIMAYHLSAYVHKKQGCYEEAVKDIDEGLSLISEGSAKRFPFEYLKNIILFDEAERKERKNVDDVLRRVHAMAIEHGKDYPRFWVQYGYFVWRIEIKGDDYLNNLNDVIGYTRNAVDIVDNLPMDSMWYNEFNDSSSSKKPIDKFFPCYIVAHANLTRCYVDIGDFDSAKESLRIMEGTISKYMNSDADALPLFNFIKAYFYMKTNEKIDPDLIDTYIARCVRYSPSVSKIARSQINELFLERVRQRGAGFINLEAIGQ